MSKTYWLLSAGLLFSMGLAAQKKDNNAVVAPPVVADSAKKAPAAPPKPSVSEKTKSSKKSEGLFTIYQDTASGTTQIYVRKSQLEKEFIYQSFSLAGPTGLFLNQNMIRANFIFKIHKSFDKIEFATQNLSFYYDPTNAVSKSANVDAPEATFISEKILVEDADGYLIAADGLFVGEKLDPVKPLNPPGLPPTAVFNLGNLNPTKSKVAGIRSYPNNTDVIVELAYDNPMPFNQGGKDITDARFNKVKLQHSFLEVPVNNFKARRDDPRVGYFGSEVDDLTSLSPTPYKDIINRWNLVKKDPNAAVSEPVEPIVWWIENTTPVELRPYVLEAGRRWNEAFEKAGFKNAVVMKEMPDTATWDPADIRYNVIRWVSSSQPQYGAIGPSFTNPRTGQILGADITVEWRSGAGTPIFNDLYNKSFSASQWEAQAEANTTMQQMLTPQGKKHWATCNMAQELAAQFTVGATAIEVLDGGQAPAKDVPEMHQQFLYYLILHEMGHTMGLNHNMKASQMLSPAEVNNTEITHKIGLQGSVMDYPAINVALDRSKQGDYYTTKVGPYDVWAIEYGYTPFNASEEEAGLNKILARSTDPKLVFGNDADDMRGTGSGIDPRVMVNDMSNDMVAYADERFKLVNVLMGKLKAKYTDPGTSYATLRSRYSMVFGQRSQMANAVANYIGGVYVDRSYPGQGSTVKPYTPVPVAYQKKAMELLSKNVFAPNAFDADAPLYPYLQGQRRGFGYFGATEDPKPQNAVLNLQVSVLQRILNPATTQRINTSSLYGNTYSVADVMNDLMTACFAADIKSNVNLYRQNLQTEFVKGVASIANAPAGFDNATKAAALSTLKKIKSLLVGGGGNAQSVAHRTNLNFLIDKALAVK
ncbi:MAG TPA: zinc-dependent metalloprotease [Phnomibacter sp.]|nr:zinc-dependent metalloprotease [Phnomibacter sp.]